MELKVCCVARSCRNVPGLKAAAAGAQSLLCWTQRLATSRRSLAALEARAAAATGQLGAIAQGTASAIASRALGPIAQAAASTISSRARCERVSPSSQNPPGKDFVKSNGPMAISSNAARGHRSFHRECWGP